jgi:glycyl-tRNA synthetase
MQQDPEAPASLETLTTLCKRRGFIFQSSEIYNGINGFWDFGPLGTELKNNLRDAWWQDMVRNPPLGPDGEPVDIVGLDSAIIQNPSVWKASGHLGGFNDPMADCRQSKSRYRADHLMVLVPKSGQGTAFAYLEGEEESAHKRLKKKAKADPSDYEVVPFPEIPTESIPNVWGPDATEPGTLTEPRQFNLMFKTFIGAMSGEGEDNTAYLRPETAQGIFINYKNVVDTMRVKLPFGIAQVGKSFRNEVTPRNFIFRSREFEQMEME